MRNLVSDSAAASARIGYCCGSDSAREETVDKAREVVKEYIARQLNA